MTCEQVKGLLVDAGPGAAHRVRDAAGHLLECEECRSLLLAGGLLGETPLSAPASSTACPSTEILAGTLDGSLRGVRREEWMSHVASCETCAGEVLSLAKQMESLDRAEGVAPARETEERAIRQVGRSPRAALPSRFSSWVVPLVRSRPSLALASSAALVLLAVAVGVFVIGPPPGERPAVLRGEAASSLEIVSPRGEVLSARGLRFIWKEPPPGSPGWAPRYRLVVADLASGRTIIEAVTDQTSYTLGPEEASRLEPGVPYHWLVEPMDDAPGRASEAAVFHFPR